MTSPEDAEEIRPHLRWALWLHAVLWALFASGMVAAAALSPEARVHPVFLQVLAGSLVASVGAFAAALYRTWGVLAALLGGFGVLLAWIAGDSGDIYRLPLAISLAVFGLVVVVDRRAFLSSRGR